MPQIIPFFFANQAIFLFLDLGFVLFFMSKYFLPSQLQAALSRSYLTSL